MLSFLRPLVKPLFRPFRPVLEREFDRRVWSHLRRVPIGQLDEADVFVVGYPKSGNTWLQNLIAGVVYGIDPELAPYTIIREVVPDVHSNHYYRRYSTPMFFKSHHLPRAEYRKVVYLVRDGRDVLVSYYHHLCALNENAKVNLVETVRTGEGLFPSKWHTHVRAWLANPYDAQMITIKYEDLMANPVGELERFCVLSGLHRDRSFLEQMIAKSAFEVMQRKEIRDGGGWINRWPQNRLFVRRGKIGSFKDEMPAEALRFFLEESTETLFLCGYEV